MNMPNKPKVNTFALTCITQVKQKQKQKQKQHCISKTNLNNNFNA